jgi:putative membrane protein
VATRKGFNRPVDPVSHRAFFCLFLGRPGATLVRMLWVKSFHIIFVASWFAGLFYLPRIFVNLAMVPAGSVAERERLLLMARKLLRFTTILAVPAVALGLWLWLGYGIGRGPGNAWMHAKLGVVVVVIGYHHSCARMLARFEAHRNTHSHIWWRWYNELPVLLLVAAVVLVVVKPWQG